jgi:hypothetical protein
VDAIGNQQDPSTTINGGNRIIYSFSIGRLVKRSFAAATLVRALVRLADRQLGNDNKIWVVGDNISVPTSRPLLQTSFWLPIPRYVKISQPS